MNESDDDVQPMTDFSESPRGGGRWLNLALLIGLVVCALLAVGAVFYAQREIAALTQARDAAQRDNQKLMAAGAAAAANGAKVEQSLAAARAERDEMAQLVVAVRQNPNTGRDIKHERVPFKWAGKKKEDGLDSSAFKYLGYGSIKYE